MTSRDALAAAIHELRWCKWSDMMHTIAHDDDSDGHGAAFLSALAAEGWALVRPHDAVELAVALATAQAAPDPAPLDVEARRTCDHRWMTMDGPTYCDKCGRTSGPTPDPAPLMPGTGPWTGIPKDAPDPAPLDVAEAVAAERQRIAAAVEGLPGWTMPDAVYNVSRAAVLAIVSEP